MYIMKMHERDDEDDDDDIADVYLYEDIGDQGWGESKTAKQFADDLKGLGAVKKINLRINSNGGNVFDGMAMYALLKAHKATVTTKIDGLAASIASVIAMAGDDIEIADGGMMMIHDPWTLAMGNADELRGAADTLDQVGQAIANVYAKRVSLNMKDIRAKMSAETWMTSEDCVKFGFADKVVESSKAKACVPSGKFEFKFKNRPASMIAQVTLAERTAAFKKRIADENKYLKTILAKKAG